MNKLLIVSLTFFIVGTLMIPLTFYYSNLVIYAKSFHIFLGERSGYSISFNGNSGDLAEIKGFSSSPVLIYEENPPEGGVYLGTFQGNFSKSFEVLPFKQILIEGGNYPSNVTAQIIVYNTDFSQVGYTTSGLLISLGLILLGYYFALMKGNNNKIRKKGKNK